MLSCSEGGGELDGEVLLLLLLLVMDVVPVENRLLPPPPPIPTPRLSDDTFFSDKLLPETQPKEKINYLEYSPREKININIHTWLILSI